MRDQSEIWRQRLWVWLPALLFFLANAVAFSIYRFGYADRVQALNEDLDKVQEELQPVQARRVELETLLRKARTTETQVAQLYGLFSTPSQRSTSAMTEVRNLSRRAGLDFRSINYGKREVEDIGLIRHSFTFSVAGTYGELRQFINLLELSPSFLILDEIGLSESSGEEGVERGSELRITLTLSTLYTGEEGDSEGAGVAQRTAPVSAPGAAPAAALAASPDRGVS